MLDPDNYRDLMRQLLMPAPELEGEVRVLGLTVVVIPIPEVFYIAADPYVELRQHEPA